MPFYATTPIYYVNAQPHLGHAYTTIITDSVNRFHLLCGEDARFITGTDEHGDKIVQAAEVNGKSPKEYTDHISDLFRALWPKLQTEPSGFVRTTEERHRRAVTEFLTRVNDKGDLYHGSYGGHYCFGCERFYTEKELVNGLCPDHQTAPQYIAEENYFFRMSNYQDWLIDTIKNTELIRPERYRNEALGLLREPLDDLCISRPKTRLTWGIDLPFDDKYVTYVWFDALISYITALGWPDDANGDFARLWPHAQHFVAKDILKPHAIFWPSMLKSAGLPLYKHLNVHGYWQMGRTKMGKSVGNVVDALVLADTYGVDAFRYFLARDMVFGLDSEFMEESLVTRYNADLANDLGNLWQRSLSMVQKFNGGMIPDWQGFKREEEEWAVHLLEKTIEEYKVHFNNLTINRALALVWEVISALNKFIDVQAPWALAKQAKEDPEAADKLKGVLYRLVFGLSTVAAMVWPVMPGTAEEMWRRLGLDASNMTLDIPTIRRQLVPGRPVAAGEPFFPRVETDESKAKVAKEAAKETPLKEAAPAKEAPKKAAKADIPAADEITFDEFKRLDLRLAEVLTAERIKKSDKLLKLTVKVGDEERPIVAGIGLHYEPEALIGKTVLIVANLAPAKLMGHESRGMVLAAADRSGETETLSLLSTLSPMPNGLRIS